MNAYCDDLKQFLRSKSFVAAVILIALISYGFAATNISVSIDDLEAGRYVGEDNVLLYAGRFCTPLLSNILGYESALVENSFAIDLIAIATFILSAVNLCILFRRVSQNHISMAACTVFSCIWISYPLMNEIWEYTATNLVICCGFLFSSIVLLLVHGFIHEKAKRKLFPIVIAVVLMMLICAGYEAVLPVYIFFVFAILALQIVYGTDKEKRLREVLRQGLIYAGVLCAGMLLRSCVHRAFLLITGTEAEVGGATIVYWGTEPFLNTVKTWIFGTVGTVMHSIIYFPLTELLFAMIVLTVIGIVACRKYGAVLLLPGLGMFFSLIVLSLIQGRVSPYRTCQVYGAFVAFVVMLLIVIVEQTDWKQQKKYMRPAALILAAYLCFHQAVYLNYFLTLNHIRSEEEAYVIRQVSTDLQADYDLSKPVVFVGIYELSDYVEERASIPSDDFRWKLYSSLWYTGNQLVGNRFDEVYLSRKLPQTNVNSVLRWGWNAYGQEGMQHLFSYYGCQYTPASYNEIFPIANQYASDTQMPIYPQDGYIQDMGEYIIVRLGVI